MRYYCTYFDINFASRGLVLFGSLKQHERDFVLYALCLDDETYAVMDRMNDRQFVPIALDELEAADSRLPIARANRSTIEYYFTLSPFLPLHLLRTRPDIPLITYVDADCCFYSSPQPMFDELANKSILMIEHRFSFLEMAKTRYGRYNVGLLTFRNDHEGRSCLEQWAGQCAAWCYDRVEDGKFADQKYLDEWPTAFHGVHVLQHKGVNLAPWNTANFKLSRRAGRLWIDEDPLIMYHFHGMRFIEPYEFRPTLDNSGLGSEHIRLLYIPYVQSLVRVTERHSLKAGDHVRGSLNRSSGLVVSIFATTYTWPALFWLAGLRWRGLQVQSARHAALNGIIQAFQARDEAAVSKRLREGLRRHPRLFLNAHILNILYCRFFGRPL